MGQWRDYLPMHLFGPVKSQFGGGATGGGELTSQSETTLQSNRHVGRSELGGICRLIIQLFLSAS
jgi:hypothetical protein